MCAATKIEYNSIFQTYDILDHVFKPIKEANSCLFFPVKNRLGDAMLLFYLVLRKINILVGKSNLDDPPPFCDYFITIAGNLIDFTGKNISIVPNPNREAAPSSFIDNAGYVFLTTSGTSGKPKFVRYNNIKFTNNTLNCVTRFNITSETKILIAVPINHMFGIGAGLFPGLLVNATIEILELPNIINIISRINGFNPDIVFVTPAICKMLLAMKTPISKSDRVFVSAGEKIGIESVRSFEERFGKLINLYGSTELGAVATTLSKRLPDDWNRDSLVPLDGVELKVDIGAGNEILCRHQFGFDCYVDKYCNSVKRVEADNWHRTGDSGSLINNELNIRGRIDGLINRHGFLISNAEVENQLVNSSKEVIQAIVFQIKTGKDILNDQLIAVCQVSTVDENVKLNIISVLRRSFSRHMIPDQIFLETSLPLLSSGKPDRQSIIEKYANMK